MRPVLALLCAIACLMAGCGSGGSSTPTRDSSPPAAAQPTTSTGTGEGTAPPPASSLTTPPAGQPSPATTPHASGFREQAVAVCARSHVIHSRIRTARDYARLALPLLGRTRRSLQGLEPPRDYARRVQALLTSLREVIDLYARAGTASARPDPGLRGAAIRATRRLVSVASAAGLIPCGPPVGRR
jgi:hypothetical protein